jgi:Ulp1 family protease
MLKDLRESLLTDLPNIIVFTFNKRHVHWAPCIVLTKDLVVYQGDSLHWAADETMLARLQWFLMDLMDMQGQWTKKALTVPDQGRDSGSCGIVALNAIHTFINPSVPSWRQEDAAKHRRIWLKNLFLFHLDSVHAADEVSPHTIPERCTLGLNHFFH